MVTFFAGFKFYDRVPSKKNICPLCEFFFCKPFLPFFTSVAPMTKLTFPLNPMLLCSVIWHSATVHSLLYHHHPFLCLWKLAVFLQPAPPTPPMMCCTSALDCPKTSWDVSYEYSGGSWLNHSCLGKEDSSMGWLAQKTHVRWKKKYISPIEEKEDEGQQSKSLQRAYAPHHRQELECD